VSELPTGWRTVEVGTVCRAVAKADPIATGREKIRYVDIGSVDGNSQRLGDVPEISAAGAPTRARQQLKAGDTVFSTVRPYLKKIAWIPPELDGEFASTGFCVLRPGESLDGRFLYYFAVCDRLLDQVLPLQRGVSYPAVRDRDVLGARIPLPPLDEQRRIVAVLEDHLSRLDAGQTCLTASKRRLDAMERVALGKCGEGGLRPLAEVAAIQGGIQKQQKRAPRGNAFPFLRVANVTARGLELGDVHKIELFDGELDRLRLRAGDLLVVEGNGSASQIGRAATWDGSIDDCVHQNHLIRVRPLDDLLPEYLEAVWNSPRNRAALTDVASSSSGLHTLSVSKLRRILIPVPTLGRQQELVGEVLIVREAKRRLRLSLNACAGRGEALRRSLLAAAFSGQLT